MPAFHGHHCPICSHIGDKRCIAHGHFSPCSEHPDALHARREPCVKCVEARRRQDRAARQVREDARSKENRPLDGLDGHDDCITRYQTTLAPDEKPKAQPIAKSRGNTKAKKLKTGKSMKQIRREKKAAKAIQVEALRVHGS